MPRITATVTGTKKLRIAAETMAEEIPKIGKRALRKYMKKAMEATRKYPPQPRGSRYVRTGAYFRGFRLEDSGSGKSFSTTIFSGRPKGSFIGGGSDGGGQSWNTKHWPLLRREVDRVLSEAVDGITDAMGFMVKKLFSE